VAGERHEKYSQIEQVARKTIKGSFVTLENKYFDIGTLTTAFSISVFEPKLLLLWPKLWVS
jgi:hypothetical protein